MNVQVLSKYCTVDMIKILKIVLQHYKNTVYTGKSTDRSYRCRRSKNTVKFPVKNYINRRRQLHHAPPSKQQKINTVKKYCLTKTSSPKSQRKIMNRFKFISFNFTTPLEKLLSLPGHCWTLYVPPWSPWPPRRWPRGFSWFSSLPQGKVSSMLLLRVHY